MILLRCYTLFMDILQQGARELGINLTDEQVKKFSTYYQELIEWNRKINLTAISGYEEVQIKHFLDSLTVAACLKSVEPSPRGKLADIGTGAGFPGIPLAITMPSLEITLIEATRKKTDFLHHIAGILSLDNIEVINARSEELARNEKYRGKYDYVTARAVAELPALVEIALPFCRVGGIFFAMKKGNIQEELAETEGALALLNGAVMDIKYQKTELFGDNRCLVVIKKTEDTPSKYPRRPGIPEKRPLKGGAN